MRRARFGPLGSVSRRDPRLEIIYDLPARRRSRPNCIVCSSISRNDETIRMNLDPRMWNLVFYQICWILGIAITASTKAVNGYLLLIDSFGELQRIRRM